jgi:hypothetical protein
LFLASAAFLVPIDLTVFSMKRSQPAILNELTTSFSRKVGSRFSMTPTPASVSAPTPLKTSLALAEGLGTTSTPAATEPEAVSYTHLTLPTKLL